ncbi:MAG: hypothetical protein AAF462_07610 [Thermodesulfobacteriota bacterium]
MARKQSSRSKKKTEPQVDLSDLTKAGEHFIASAAEFVVGAGFAMKGAKNLMDNEEGRQFLRDLPSKAAEKGFEFLTEVTEQIKEKEKRKSKRTSRSRSRKIEVE